MGIPLKIIHCFSRIFHDIFWTIHYWGYPHSYPQILWAPWLGAWINGKPIPLILKTPTRNIQKPWLLILKTHKINPSCTRGMGVFLILGVLDLILIARTILLTWDHWGGDFFGGDVIIQLPIGMVYGHPFLADRSTAFKATLYVYTLNILEPH